MEKFIGYLLRSDKMKTLIIIALVLQSIGLFIKLMLSIFKDNNDNIELNGLIGYSMLSIVPTLFFEFLYIYLLCVL